MKYIFFFDEGMGLSVDCAFKAWAKALGEEGYHVQFLAPFTYEEPWFLEQGARLARIFPREKINLQGDLVFTATEESYLASKELLIPSFLVWNSYNEPPSFASKELVVFSSNLKDYLKEHYDLTAHYLPPILEEACFANDEDFQEGDYLVYWEDENSDSDLALVEGAFDLLKGSLPRLKLLITGPTKSAENPSLTTEKKPFPLEFNERRRLFQGARAIICSKGPEEALSWPILEIMALGRPIIAFSQDALGEYAVAGKTFIALGQIKKEKNIALEILRILRQGKIRANIIENAQNFVKKLRTKEALGKIESWTLQILDLKERKKALPLEKELVDLLVVGRVNPKDLQDCLDAIKKNTQWKYRLIVLDNDYHKEKGEHLSQVRNYKEAILAARGEYIAFLKSKLLVEPFWLTELVNCFLKDPQLAMACPKILTEDSFTRCGLYEEALDICSPFSNLLINDENEKIKELDHVGGGCFVIKRENLNIFGLPDEELAFYFMKADYALRIKEKGYKNVYNPLALARRKKGVEEAPDLRSVIEDQRTFKSKWEWLLEQRERVCPKYFVILANQPWPQNKDFFISMAARGYRVLYINPSCSAEGLKEIATNLFCYSLSGQGSVDSNLSYGAREEEWGESLKNLVSESVYLWVEAPFWLAMVKYFNFRRLIYYCQDDFTGVNDELLLKLSDLVFFSSPKLYLEKKALGNKVHFFPPAIDNALYNEAFSSCHKRQGELANLEGPLLLCLGPINASMDFTLLEELARGLLKGTLVLVGSVEVPVSPIEKLPNVHFLGQLEEENLVNLLNAASLCLILQKNLEDLSNIYIPLAAARPVFSLEFRGCEKFAHLVTFLERKEYVSSVLAFLANNPWGISLEERKRLVEGVREANWQTRLEELENFLGLEGMDSQKENFRVYLSIKKWWKTLKAKFPCR